VRQLLRCSLTQLWLRSLRSSALPSSRTPEHQTVASLRAGRVLSGSL